jgi:hypothetical protein
MTEENLIQAMRDGTARRGAARRLVRKGRVSRNITIRMAEADLDLTRKQAEKKDCRTGLTLNPYDRWH